MPNASSKPVAVIYFALTTPADMVAAMEAMLAVQYSGILVCNKDAQDVVTWNLQIDGPDDRRLVAVLGDVLVYEPTSNHLDSMNADAFAAQYTVS